MRAAGVADPVSQDVRCGPVVVGFDGSRHGLAVLDWAAEEAAASGHDLTICHADPAPTPDGADPLLAGALRRARDRLGSRRVAVRLFATPADDALLRLANTASLVVLGGAPVGVAHRLLGSTVLRVAGRSPAPSVVIRPGTGWASTPFDGHVVVGVDGSSHGSAALMFGFAFATRHRAPLAVVHVAPTSPCGSWIESRDPLPAAEPPGLAALTELVEPFRRAYPQVPVERAVLVGHPADQLLAAVDRALLLVVGRRARRHLPAVTLGSTSQAIVARAPCPVAVCP